MELVCDGRLTLEAGVPISNGNQTEKTTIFFVPYQGNKIALYSARKKGKRAGWTPMEIPVPDNCSVTVPATTSLPFDIFALIGTKQQKGDKRAKVTTVALETLDWSNATTRQTELTTQDGVLVKDGDPTWRYLGTGCTTADGDECEDSDKRRFLWNYYHRDKRRLQVSESIANWVSGSNAWQRANNSDNNRVEAVIGVQTGGQETNLNLTVAGAVRTATTATASLAVAIGEDSTTTPAGDQIGRGTVQASTAAVTLRAHYHAKPAPGLHYWQWLQIGTAGGNKTWYYTDTSGNLAYKNGIVGWIEG